MSRTYWAASYGPRYGDPIATLVALEPLHELRPSLIRDRINEANQRAWQYEIGEMPGYCRIEHGDEDEISVEDCSLCTPDVTYVDAYSYSACDLFSVKELREHRRELVKGEIVVVTL